MVDRSRYLAGLQQCQMYRYYQYHAANGYGFTRKSTSLPLTTGISVHAGLAELLVAAKEKASLPTPAAVEAIVSKQVAAYNQLIKAKGFQATEDNAEVEHTRKEQAALISGLIWGWYRAMLPFILEQFEIVDVEREEMLILDNIGLMSKPDWVGRRKADGTLGIHDFKTAGIINDAYVQEYKHSVQMMVGTVAVEQRLKEPVTHYYIHGLLKGQRRSEYNTSSREYDGPRRQQSFLCYVYEKTANPPLNTQDLQPKWKYKDEAGANRVLGSAYSKKPLWEVTDAKSWTESLQMSSLWEIFPVLGPYARQTWMVDKFLREFQAEEQRWIAKLHRLYEDESRLAEEIPRSWDCYKYGSPCQYLPICYGEVQDPLGSGKYELRLPHHSPEVDQAKARGAELPSERNVEDEVE